MTPIERVQLIVALVTFMGSILFIIRSIPFWNQLITYAMGKPATE
jgi:hypothetical protein